MPFELVTRTAKRVYEEKHLTNITNGIDKLVFRIDDTDTSSSFMLDKYVSTPYAAAYRNSTNQSHVRNFTPGQSELIKPPRLSEKTPIDETLRDQIAVGVEPTDSALMSLIKNEEQIIDDHVEAITMTKWKQTFDILSTGIFNAPGIDGADLGLSINYGRDGSQSITADFSAIDMSKALLNIQTQLRATGTPLGGQVVIMGSNWLGEFQKDSTILTLRQTNDVNLLVQANMIPPALLNTYGLYVVSIIRASSMVAPMYICSFDPGIGYVATKGAAATAWVNADEALAFSLSDKSWNVKRGVQVFDDNGRVQTVAGDMVFDSYAENDPITMFLRSQSRHAFVYGNINHTVKSTGSNYN